MRWKRRSTSWTCSRQICTNCDAVIAIWTKIAEGRFQHLFESVPQIRQKVVYLKKWPVIIQVLKKTKFFNSCTLSWDLTFFQIEKKNLKTVVIVELCSVKLTHHWTKHIQNRSKEKKNHVHLHCSQRGIYSNLNRATGLYSASSPFRKIAPHALLNKQAMPQLWKHVLP